MQHHKQLQMKNKIKKILIYLSLFLKKKKRKSVWDL